MKEHGLLFSAPMAHARHLRKKWQTRRPITAYNSIITGLPKNLKKTFAWEKLAILGSDAGSVLYMQPPQGTFVHAQYPWPAPAIGIASNLYITPRIQPGHAIWWKETHKLMATDSTRYYPELIDGRPIEENDPNEEEFPIWIPIYRATDTDIDLVLMDGDDEDEEKRVPWRPSLLMKRKWARFVDLVVSVRPERLLDITDADAIAEGISAITKDGGITIKYGIPDRDGMPGTDDHGWPWHEWCNTPREAYLKLWEKLNGQGSAAENPWLWVYTMQIPDLQ